MSRFACFAFVFGALCSAQIPRGGTTGKAAAPPPKAPAAAPIVPDLPQAQTKARIEGQVFSLAGAALAGASITLRSAPPTPIAAITSVNTTSGEEGKFVFEQVEPGPIRFRRSDPDTFRRLWVAVQTRGARSASPWGRPSGRLASYSASLPQAGFRVALPTIAGTRFPTRS